MSLTMRKYSFFLLLALLMLFSTANALFAYGLSRCWFTSPDDLVYVDRIYFNKVLIIQYSSKSGNFTGYTEKTKEIADDLNKNPYFLREEKKNEEKCKAFIPLAFEILSKPVKPSVRLKSVKAAGSRHPGMLVCSVYSFYPEQILVTWLRNGKKVTADVTSTEELPNGNWLYQLQSYLEYTPTPGERISCMVEHATLMEPMIYDWDPTPQSEGNKIALGAAGLLLGLVFFLAGLIYWKKNATGLVLVPTSSGSLPL